MFNPSLVPLCAKAYKLSDFALDCYLVDMLSCLDVDAVSCLLRQAVFDSDLSDVDYRRFYRFSIRYIVDVLGKDPFVVFPFEIRSKVLT